jgi:RNA polymerase sigma factor (sigma-70 family)
MKLEEVVKFMDSLKKEHKDVLIMRIWDNLSYREIAEITGLSESNCKKIVSRNLVKINEAVVYSLLLFLIII